MKHAFGILLSTIVAVAVAPVVSSSAAPAQTPTPSRHLSWLAAGDSYSSGEGIEDSTGVCHQSRRAYAARSATLLQEQAGWSVTQVFVACTGAITSDFYNRRNKTYPPQVQWASHDGPSQYDIVTLSMGGNDLGFAGIMMDCIGLDISWSTILDPSEPYGCDQGNLDDRIVAYSKGADPTLATGCNPAGGPCPDSNFGPNGGKLTLAEFYATVARRQLSPDGLLIVVGYPSIFAPSQEWPAWRHDHCGPVSAADADMLDALTVKLEQAQVRAIRDASAMIVGSGKAIEFVSRYDLHNPDSKPSRGLCGSGTSWMNGLGAIWYSNTLESPFHPNELSHEKTGAAVAQLVLDHFDTEPEEEAPAPTGSPIVPTSEPPAPSITPSSPEYDIGSEFSEPCYVAWPTAPVHTSDSIQMTMACSNVPGQYLFVVVSYPDPDLPITPSTGTVLVHGQITDIATSEFGYRELIVLADAIDLDPE